jgi:hypothetical protein
MKWSFPILLIFLLGCSSDLDIIYKQEPVPVIYAAINPYDSVHYVRVQKTFVMHTKADWENLNADSMQFHDVEVHLYGKKGDVIQWSRQLTEITVNKYDGLFPSEGVQAFKLDGRLPINNADPRNDSLVLEVNIHDLNITTKASAAILRPAHIINYKSRYTIYVYGSYPSVYAMTSTGERNNGHAFSESYKQIEFKVHLTEYYPDSEIEKVISWTANEGFDNGFYFITPTRLFNPIKARLSNPDSLSYRILDSIDLAMMKPSRFFNNYWYVREYWEGSERPPYSNFDNSYGMFFTLVRDEWTGMQLFWRDLDSLCKGYYYEEMKFR